MKLTKMHRIVFLSLLGLSVVSLASCSHSSGNYVRLKEGESNSFQFDSSFSDGVYEIVSKSGSILAPVSGDIVKGFSTRQTIFDKDLEATASYEGENLSFTYQISSSFDDDGSGYRFVFDNEGGISVRFFGNPDQNATEFDIPETFSFLPSPLNQWPVVDVKASFGGFSNLLKKVMFNKSLVSFEPLESENLPSLQFVPSPQGRIRYDQRGFLIIGSTLWGIDPAFQGSLLLPTEVTIYEESAFAGVLPNVTKVVIPKAFGNPNFTLSSYRMDKNLAFEIVDNGNGYFSKDGFILYSSGNDTICRGVPAGLKCQNDTLTIPVGVNRFVLDALYGFANPTMKRVVLPSTVTSFKDGLADLANTVLESLRFTSSEMVSTTSISVGNLPKTLERIEVPSSLLEQYKTAAGWVAVSDKLVGFD